MDKNILMKWYLDNGIYDIIEQVPFCHFEKKDVLEPINIKIIEEKGTKNENKIVEKPINDVNKKIIYARKLADDCNTLNELREKIENFNQLDIEKLAKNVVFADGNVESKVMLIGEAPGADEDERGIPFCGESGKLLMEMFKSIGYERSKLYIANTLFWRPPGNRTPTKEEIAICRPFIEKHIALKQPKIIICVGATAFSNIIDSNLSITSARKQVFEYKNQYITRPIKTIAIFHPSYLLRVSVKKKDAWQDMLFIKNSI
ncbi:MAG: uracil-DNA glycosylase [Rickettsiales bacterium]|jgi:DNA polymerase|nr:uracil-DNA glycosylase [Rickettsiales bacterium]